jgi:hypothetical protein
MSALLDRLFMALLKVAMRLFVKLDDFERR